MSYNQARQNYALALGIRKALLGPVHLSVLHLTTNLARLFVRMEKVDDSFYLLLFIDYNPYTSLDSQSLDCMPLAYCPWRFHPRPCHPFP